MKPETETFTAYISKYALTKGIEAVHGKQFYDYRGYLDAGRNVLYRTGDWHLTREDAIERAEEMRKKKIESLKKQIAKLEKMKF